MARSGRGIPRPAILAIAGLLVLPACGGEKESRAEAGSPRGVAAACVAPTSAVQPPSQLARFPFPEGSVLTGSRKQADAAVVEGYVPGRSLDQVRDELNEQIPARGYTLGEGDAEEHEAETEFSGRSIDGRLKIRDDVCSGAVSFGVSATAGK